MFEKTLVSALSAAAAFALTAFVASSAIAADSSAPPPAGAPATSADAAPQPAVVEITGKPPLEILKDHPFHTMKNPYTDKADMIEEGKKLYFAYSCNGCHGGGGGGGMCPPLTNDTWVYGADDDTLYRLITLGSQDLQKTHSIKRKGQESVVGPMPPFGALIKSDDEAWKIIAFVRSLYKGNRRLW